MMLLLGPLMRKWLLPPFIFPVWTPILSLLSLLFPPFSCFFFSLHFYVHKVMVISTIAPPYFHLIYVTLCFVYSTLFLVDYGFINNTITMLILPCLKDIDFIVPYHKYSIFILLLMLLLQSQCILVHPMESGGILPVFSLCLV